MRCATLLFTAALAALAVPATAMAQSVQGDFDGDGKPDRAFVQLNPGEGAFDLRVDFGNGKQTRVMRDVLGPEDAAGVALEVRDGRGDVRCAGWRPGTECGRTHEIHGGAALVVRRPGQRDLLFFWTQGTQFLLEFGVDSARPPRAG